MDPYEILEIDPSCEDRDIKVAYRKLAKASHPDTGGDPVIFKKLQEAYELIGTPARRAVYDLERRRSGVADARAVAKEVVQQYLEKLKNSE